MIDASFKVDPSQFGPGLLREWASTVRKSLIRAAALAERDCRTIYRKALIRRIEYQALFQIVHTPSAIGLQGELGLASPSQQAGDIVDLAVQALAVTPIKVQSNFFGWGRVTDFGGLRATILPSDLTFLINSPSASFQSEGGYEIPWLMWLLERGTDAIIDDYYVMYGTDSGQRGSSRTQDAIMVPSGKSGKNFKVKKYYAGVYGNNWITRAAMEALPRINQIMSDAVRKELS
jgi:hypothetical protein